MRKFKTHPKFDVGETVYSIDKHYYYFSRSYVVKSRRYHLLRRFWEYTCEYKTYKSFRFGSCSEVTEHIKIKESKLFKDEDTAEACVLHYNRGGFE